MALALDFFEAILGDADSLSIFGEVWLQSKAQSEFWPLFPRALLGEKDSANKR